MCKTLPGIPLRCFPKTKSVMEGQGMRLGGGQVETETGPAGEGSTITTGSGIKLLKAFPYRFFPKDEIYDGRLGRGQV